MMHRLFLPAFLVATCVHATSPLSRAGQLSFNIDPAQSHITLTLETADGTQVISSAQTPGSDTTSLSGTFNVDVTPGTIQFLSTNNIQFGLQAVPQAPLIDGTVGSSPAQYGLNVAIGGVGGGVVAARDYVADVTSSVIPVSGDAFDATKLVLTLTPDSISSYNLTFFGSTAAGFFTGSNPGDNALSNGTLTQVGGLETLTAAVSVVAPTTVEGVTFLGLFTGQIVATATVPEPASVLLAAIGVAVLVCCGRRRV
jgi:PEP-CTERM motif